MTKQYLAIFLSIAGSKESIVHKGPVDKAENVRRKIVFCPSAVHSHAITKAVLVRAGEKTSSNIVIENDQVSFRKSHTHFINKDLELNDEKIKLDLTRQQ